MELGPDIRRIRTDRGLTQRELATAAGVTHSYVSKIESGRLQHTPSPRALSGLAQALGIDELTLLKAADKVPAPLVDVLRDPDAIIFLRKAVSMSCTSHDWRRLSALLDDPRPLSEVLA